MSIDRKVGVVPDGSRRLDGGELSDPALLQAKGDGIGQILVEDVLGLLEVGIFLDVGQIALENTLYNIQIFDLAC